MRRPVKNRKQPGPDPVYQSERVAKFINCVMERGKKTTAQKVVYDAFDMLKGKDGKENPIEIFETALQNVGPTVEVRSRRVGGANYQVPREVRPERRLALALRWIIAAARSTKGKPMAVKLADEIKKAANNEGEAIKKRDTVHKMAEANKVFAHFAW
jgi:small subunit ribosomal protein S7